jgi:hypothetical protein
VLLVSGYADRWVGTSDAFGLGWPLIAKPFSAPALLAHIQQLLGREAS